MSKLKALRRQIIYDAGVFLRQGMPDYYSLDMAGGTQNRTDNRTKMEEAKAGKQKGVEGRMGQVKEETEGRTGK